MGSGVYDLFDSAYAVGYEDGYAKRGLRDGIANDPEIGINYRDGYEDGRMKRDDHEEDGR